MIKAGLIGAVVGFIYVGSLTLLSPFCTICLTPIFGVAIGYLAGWFDNPNTLNLSISKGIVAGAIAGLGAIAGQMLATFISTILIVNFEQLPDLMAQMGLSDFIIADATEYWQITLTTNGFCSLMNLVVIIGLAALGGIFWFQRQNRQQISSTF